MAYITTSEMKSTLGMASSDSTRDAELTLAAEAASKLIDNQCGRVFTLDASATARTFTPDDHDGILLVDDIGSATGLVVETGTFGSSTWETVASTDYEVSPLNALAQGKPVTGIVRPYRWGLNAYSRVRVTAKWGWPSVPYEVEQATMLQAIRLFKRKDSPGGVMGSEEFMVRISKVDPDVQALIQHLIRPGFGG